MTKHLLSSSGCEGRELESPNAFEQVHIEYRHHNLESGHKVWIVKSVNRKYCFVEESDGDGHAAIAEASK